jgi:hypothetical protein
MVSELSPALEGAAALRREPNPRRRWAQPAESPLPYLASILAPLRCSGVSGESRIVDGLEGYSLNIQALWVWNLVTLW